MELKYDITIDDSVIRLDLTHNVEKGTVSFTMADFDISEKVYSSASFCIMDSMLMPRTERMLATCANTPG